MSTTVEAGLPNQWALVPALIWRQNHLATKWLRLLHTGAIKDSASDSSIGFPGICGIASDPRHDLLNARLSAP